MKKGNDDRTISLFNDGSDGRGTIPVPMPGHDGKTYDAALDKVRLNAQTLRVYEAMRDGRWRTLVEIAAITGDPQASVSARLRDLRKEKFGSHPVERRRRGPPKSGIFEYRVVGYEN